MEEKTKYFVLKKKAVPEVLLKVVEAKKLLESERAESVQEATDMVGISRSSFYKYKDDIFPFHDNARGKTITRKISQIQNIFYFNFLSCASGNALLIGLQNLHNAGAYGSVS